MPEKIEKQEVWFIDGGYQSFHAQAIPILATSYLVVSEPNKSYSWIIPLSSIRKCKLNVRPTLKTESKILTPATKQVLIK